MSLHSTEFARLQIKIKKKSFYFCAYVRRGTCTLHLCVIAISLFLSCGKT